MMHFTVVVFPGTNCDSDCFHVLKSILDDDVSYIWHKDTELPKTDCVILPGGFSYGDYLRSGSIARFSPIMNEVTPFAQKGGFVFGICNGFQILLETGLLPGAMLRNKKLKFICKDVYLKTENNATPFTSALEAGQILKIPIAHMDGNYYADDDVIADLKEHNQIVFRYCSPSGEVSEDFNPNGSLENIAGIINKEGNVLGMMPHPERCSEDILGNNDGLLLFQSILSAFQNVT